MTSAQAYDQARHEFYTLRQQEEVEQRLAREEALSTGAYFGMSTIDVGLELEDKEYERWKETAMMSVQTMAQRRAAGLAILPSAEPSGEPSETEALDEPVDVEDDIFTPPEAVEE